MIPIPRMLKLNITGNLVGFDLVHFQHYSCAAAQMLTGHGCTGQNEP